MKTETKVGMFFLLGLIIIGIITFQVEDLGTVLRPKYEIRGQVRHAAGLSEGDTVNIAGVKVGDVKEMILLDDKVEIVMRIDSQYRIREDAIAGISWSGLLGAKNIDITMGSLDQPFKKPGDMIEMKESYMLDDLFEGIEVAVSEVRELLTGEQFEGIGALAERVEKAFSEAGEILADIREGKGFIGRLFADEELFGKLEDIAANLQETSDEVNRIAREHGDDFEEIIVALKEAAPQIRGSVAAFQRFAEQAEKGEGPLGMLLNDEKLAADIQDTVERIRNFAQQIEEGEGLLHRLIADGTLAEELEETVKNLREITARIEAGEGTVGKLLFEDELYIEIMALVQDVRDTIRSAREQVPVGAFTSVIMGAF